MPDLQAPRAIAQRGPVLMSSDNPDGWKLEALLPQLRAEVFARSERLVGDMRPVARHVLSNNAAVIGLLAQAEALVRESLAQLAAIAPDAGPGGTPRIGPGSPGYPAASEPIGS